MNDILFNETATGIGEIILNRPQVLNAFSYPMIQALSQQLNEWATNENIKAVSIRSNSERAFCAGGDIRQLHASEPAKAAAYFEAEYRLTTQIKNYPKPYIALLNGITMGGGAGISIHGSYRIATDRFIFAMPETGIGFFPDVGASYFLSRCPGQIGIYLGLTGVHISAADALYAGLIDQIINPKTESSHLETQRTEIDRCFSGETVEEILENLQKTPTLWHQETARLLLTRSPTSLKVTLRQLRLGIEMNFHRCMQMEYHLATHFVESHDFYEGIRALLIDKDKQPHWQPPTLADVTTAMIDSYFQPQL